MPHGRCDMVALGQLWQHKGMEWLKIRVIEIMAPPSRMVKFKVDNPEDRGTHGVEIGFDQEYIVSNYNLIDQEFSTPTWEV